MWKKPATYLTLIATLLTASMLFFPFATIIGPGGENLKIMYYEKLPYLVMLITILSGGIFSVLSYKRPFIQGRVCILVSLMLIGFQIWLGIDFIRYRNDMVFSPTMLFPLVGTALEMISARIALVEGMTLQAATSLKKVEKSR